MQPRSPAPAIPYGDSEDDSEGDDDEEDDDTDPSPPRHERSAASRVMSPDSKLKARIFAMVLTAE